LSCGVGANGFVAVDDGRSGRSDLTGSRPPLRHFDWQNLLLEASCGLRVGCPAMALGGVFILLAASDLVLGCHDLAGGAHVALLERAPQAVDDHRVEQLAMAHSQSVARALQQVRCIAHRLHAARHRNLNVAGGDPLGRQHHGFQPGAAHFVNGERGNVIRKAAAQRRLPGRSLPQTSRDDVAHDAFLHRRGIDAGPRDGFTNNQRAEFGGRQILQAAEKLAGRRSNRRDDDGVFHNLIVRERERPDALRRRDVDAADDVVAEQGAKAGADEAS
jgi:hypothetical protein